MARISPYQAGMSEFLAGNNPPAFRPRGMSEKEWNEYLSGYRDARRAHNETEPDYGGVLGADNQVHSDADPGL